MESCNGLEFVRGRLLDAKNSSCKLLCGSNDSIGGCDDGHSHGVMLETNGVGETLAAYPFHDGMDAVVVFQRWTNVPTIGGMKTPRLATRWFEMNKKFGARRGHGCSIKQVGAFHGLKHEEEGILAAWTKHVDGVVALVGEAAPVGNGENFGRLAIPVVK
jgi:hypothetical protein